MVDLGGKIADVTALALLDDGSKHQYILDTVDPTSRPGDLMDLIPTFGR